MDGALRSKLAGLAAAPLTDAVRRLFLHRAHIIDLVSPTPGRVLFGRAATIRYVPFRQGFSDERKPSFARFFYEAIAENAEGTVLVVNNPVDTGSSIGGGVKFSRLHHHKLAGLITDARLRDFTELAAYHPVFYCGGEAAQAGSETVMPIAANVPVNVRGTTILPGDYIYADAAAVVVIPATHVDRVFDLAHEIGEQDKAFLQMIRTEDPEEVRRRGSDEV